MKKIQSINKHKQTASSSLFCAGFLDSTSLHQRKFMPHMKTKIRSLPINRLVRRTIEYTEKRQNSMLKSTIYLYLLQWMMLPSIAKKNIAVDNQPFWSYLSAKTWWFASTTLVWRSAISSAKLQELRGWHELALIPESPRGIGKSGKRSCKMMNYGIIGVGRSKKNTFFSIEKTIMFIWGINEYVIHIISWSSLLRRYQSYGRWFWWGIYSRGAMTVPCIQVEQTTSLTSQIDDVDTITL